MSARALPALVLLLTVHGTAAAHTRSQSYSSWNADGATLTGVYQAGAQRVTQLGEATTLRGLEDVLATHLAETVRVNQGAAECRARSPRPLTAARGDIRVELAFDCPATIADAPVKVVLGAFFDASPSHVHYARIAREGGQAREVLVTDRSRTFTVGDHAAAPRTDFAAFVRLGLEHVLSGIDHLAFIAALALLAGSAGRVLWAATGFTLGHSVTLGLVAIGWLSPDVRSVEALIGFTVAFAAGEAYALRSASAARTGWLTLALVAVIPLAAKLAGASLLPWTVLLGTAVFAVFAASLGGAASRRVAPMLAVAFGLAHGAGFAGGLLELDIPQERLLLALLGFNVGVELGQLLALGTIAAVAYLASRLHAPLRRRALDYGLVALFALGVFWFVERSLTLA